METQSADIDSLDTRLARRLREMRTGRGWSLDDLAGRSGVSRATLSRLEKAEVSPTTSVLAKLCAAYQLTLSRLLHMIEDEFAAVVRRSDQPVWDDPAIGFRRRSVSPPGRALAGEVLDVRLEAGTRISYEDPPRPGLEHHLVLLDGRLQVTVGGVCHDLKPGDCLRYLLSGPSLFVTPKSTDAHYLLFLV